MDTDPALLLLYYCRAHWDAKLKYKIKTRPVALNLAQVFHKRQFDMLQCLSRNNMTKGNQPYIVDVMQNKSTVLAEDHKYYLN